MAPIVTLVYFLFLTINYNLAYGKVAHYSNAAIKEDKFNIFKITTANKGIIHCSTKCNTDNECEGYIYNEDDESCSLGEFHATDLICPNGDEDEIQIQFDQHSMEELVPDWEAPMRYAIFHSTAAYFFTYDQDDDQFSIVNIQSEGINHFGTY